MGGVSFHCESNNLCEGKTPDYVTVVFRSWVGRVAWAGNQAGCSPPVWFVSKISRARHVYCANISSAFLLWAVHQSLNTEISPASPTPPCLISFSAVGELKQNTTQSEPDITNVCKDKTLFKGTQLTSSGQVLVLKENHGKLLTGKWFKIISARTKYLKKVLKRRKVLVRPTPWQCST